MIDQLIQFLKDYPEAWPALAAGGAAPLDAARRLFRGFQQKKFLTAALLRVQEEHTAEVNLLRSENAQLIELHAKAMRGEREKREKQAKESMRLLLESFTKGL